MKNLGKMILKGAKTAVVGYCAYKLIDAAIKNRKEKEPEEYVPFDELPVEEPEKEDKIKKAVMIAGGLAIAYSIGKRIEKICNVIDNNFDVVNDRITMNTAFATAGYYSDNNIEKVIALVDLKNRFINRPDVVKYIDDILNDVEVK